MVELSPWTNPAAYVALPLAAFCTGLLKWRFGSSFELLIVPAGVYMFAIAFALAATVQFLIRPVGGQKMTGVRALLNVLGLLGLFGAVLFSVSPLMRVGGIWSESIPVNGGRVMVAMLMGTCAAAALASLALRRQGMFSQRWWWMVAYWSCFVPAAVFAAVQLGEFGWLNWY